MGWVLGATVSPRILEADLQKELLNDIVRVRYGRNGYIFVWTTGRGMSLPTVHSRA